MRIICKKICFLACLVFGLILIPSKDVQAVTVVQGGINYELNEENNTAEVISLTEEGKQLVDIKLPQTVENDGKTYQLVGIAACAFMGNAVLENIVIPEGVVNLGAWAFIGCMKLKTVSIPESVVFKAEQQVVFGYCEELETVKLPSSTTVIPPGLFCECVKLKHIEIPSGVTEIGYRSFQKCESLESIIIPAGVTAVGYDTFDDCPSLKDIYYPISLKEQMVEASIPETTIQMGYMVNEDGTVTLEVIYLPEGVTEIILPESVDGKPITTVTGLENTEIKVKCTNHSAKVWGKDATQHWISECSVCGKVENIVKEKHSYGDGTKACVCGYVPFTLKMEEKNITAMYGEEKMITFDVTATATLGTEKIMYEWFEDGKSIIKGNVASFGVPIGKEVGTYTYYCKVSCGAYSVQSADVKVTITVPKKGKVFCHTRSGGKYKIVKNSKKKKEVTYVKPMNAKKTETIPDTIKVGGATYKVTGIAAKAFQKNRKITKVTIGTNVTSIGAKAFYKCTKLKSIHIKSKKLTTKKVGSKAFANTHKKVTVKIPKKKLNTYKKMLKTKGISTKAKYKKL